MGENYSLEPRKNFNLLLNISLNSKISAGCKINFKTFEKIIESRQSLVIKHWSRRSKNFHRSLYRIIYVTVKIFLLSINVEFDSIGLSHASGAKIPGGRPRS